MFHVWFWNVDFSAFAVRTYRLYNCRASYVFLMVYACMFVSANVDSKLICSSFINGEGKCYCLSRFTNSFNLLLFWLNVFINQSPLHALKESFAIDYWGLMSLKFTYSIKLWSTINKTIWFNEDQQTAGFVILLFDCIQVFFGCYKQSCMYMYTLKLHRLMLIRKMKKNFHDYPTYSLNLYV